MRYPLEAIRECLDGAIPATVATCATDGTPNVSYLSDVHYVDDEHVALSFQFFNKTRENILANPRAFVLVVHPLTAAMYELAVEYLRTETHGPLFERMKAKLAGIASHTGMAGVFKLQGSDVYRVHAIHRVPGPELPAPPARRSRVAALRVTAERLDRCHELATLFDETLSVMAEVFGIPNAMVLMHDQKTGKLYTVGSRGYATSGVGSEIAPGEGVIGVAARERAPIRIAHMSHEYAYSKAMRDSAAEGGLAGMIATEIPFAGLSAPGSQLAVPIVSAGTLLGVLYAESPEERFFSYDDEDALVAVAAQLAMATRLLQAAEGADETPRESAAHPPLRGAPVTVRHHAANDVVFIGDDYLIKGVAGAILWKLLNEAQRTGRSEFSNRELRLDPSLRLPDVSDNLEARLVLLQRRLAERCAFLRIEKTGRGRFRLAQERPLELVEMAGPAAG